MIRLFAITGLLTVILTGCMGKFEKYITTNKGVIIVYGTNFAFTTFKPSGWYSDKGLIETNKVSMYLRPTNGSDQAMYAFGLVLTNSPTGIASVAEDLAKEIYASDLISNNLTEMTFSPVAYTVAGAKGVYAYRFSNTKKIKGVYKEVVCIIWERAVVVVVFRSDVPARFEEGLPVLAQFLSGVKYWGWNSDDIANRVIKLFFGQKR